MILTHYVNKIVDMPDNGGYGRVAVAPSVGAQESIAEIDAHYASAVADRPQLPVGQIARLWAQGVGIRVGGHQWGGGVVGGIPKGLFIHCAKHRSASSGRWPER